MTDLNENFIETQKKNWNWFLTVKIFSSKLKIKEENFHILLDWTLYRSCKYITWNIMTESRMTIANIIDFLTAFVIWPQVRIKCLLRCFNYLALLSSLSLLFSTLSLSSSLSSVAVVFYVYFFILLRVQRLFKTMFYSQIPFLLPTMRDCTYSETVMYFKNIWN